MNIHFTFAQNMNTRSGTTLPKTTDVESAASPAEAERVIPARLTPITQRYPIVVASDVEECSNKIKFKYDFLKNIFIYFF